MIGFADALAAIETAWSLERAGFAVSAFARAGSRPALRRSGSVEIHPIAAPEHDAEESVRDLRVAMRESGAAALMPLDDAAVWLCERSCEGPGSALAGPRGRQAQVALHKGLQCEAAAAAGFPVAEADFFVAPARPTKPPRFPVVVKPAIAAQQLGARLVTHGTARTCADSSEMERAIDAFEPDRALMVQPRLTGVGEGVFGLAGPDGVRAWSAHRRIRMMNPAGSGSSACVSVALDDSVRARTETMMTVLGWEGLFMLELLRDDQGEPWFIELNGRAWGSMALSRAVGLEYPAWAVAQALGLPPGPLPQTREGGAVRARHIGREVVHLLTVMRGPRTSAVAWPSRLRSAREVLAWRRGDRAYNWRRGEPGVLIADTVSTIVAAARRARRGRA
jgi:hypothetical protein